MNLRLVSIVGRPNVGKSALFNRITKTAKAIVTSVPGATRDQNIALVKWQQVSFELCDTGGMDLVGKDEILAKSDRLVLAAIEKSAAVIFVVDRKTGLVDDDLAIFSKLRKTGKPIFVAVNKVDYDTHHQDVAEFYAFGVTKLYPISALHDIGSYDLVADIIKELNLDAAPNSPQPESLASKNRVGTAAKKVGAASAKEFDCPTVIILGRPNVGKSALANRFIGKDRLLVSSKAGTTRDAIDVVITHHQQKLMLIDTAGLRRKSKVQEAVEVLSTKSAVKSINRADICVLVLDANDGFSDQDAKIVDLVVDREKSLLIAINKWDLYPKDSLSVEKYRQEFYLAHPYLEYVELVFISALTGQRTSQVLDKIMALKVARAKKIKSPDVNRAIAYINANFRSDITHKKRLKIKYGTQVGINPPAFAFYVNIPQAVTKGFEHYVVKLFRRFFGFNGTPIKIFWRSKYGRNQQNDFLQKLSSKV